MFVSSLFYRILQLSQQNLRVLYVSDEDLNEIGIWDCLSLWISLCPT